MGDLLNDQRHWYSHEVSFSDWRNVKKVEYSTNVVVTDWYSGGHSKYLRAENQKEIFEKLKNGDTITAGLDYYAVTPASVQFLDNYFLARVFHRIDKGEVITVKMWGDNSLLITKEY